MGLRELARKTGRTRPFLSRVERGLVGGSEQTVQLIADALQVPPDLITRKE